MLIRKNVAVAPGFASAENAIRTGGSMWMLEMHHNVLLHELIEQQKVMHLLRLLPCLKCSECLENDLSSATSALLSECQWVVASILVAFLSKHQGNLSMAIPLAFDLRHKYHWLLLSTCNSSCTVDALKCSENWHPCRVQMRPELLEN